MLKVLIVASEAAPFAKTGGLADVIGSLPKSLKTQGVDVRVIMPKYSTISPEFTDKMKKVYEGTVQLSWRNQYCGVETLMQKHVRTYFIDNEQYFKRDHLYGYPDDGERFSFFCRAVLAVLPHIKFMPDVIHCNDWHTGMIATILKSEYSQVPGYDRLKTVYSIHNLKYQGIFPKELVGDVLGVDWGLFNSGAIELNGCVNFMKAGIVASDYITTVSETYAEEIQQPYFGEGLDGLIRGRAARLTGIVNGIDVDLYDPKKDKLLKQHYDKKNIQNKAVNKADLQARLGLPVHGDIPIVSVISRLVESKGIDLLLRTADELLDREKLELVIVGTGDTFYEEALRNLARRHPQQVSVNIFFDDTLARQVYAGSDMFLMPSRVEPCGIGQLIALRYGTVPIVRSTGGLRDTVISYDKYGNTGNGIVFDHYNAHEMLYAIKRGIQHFQFPYIWNKLVQNAIDSDYSWATSAAKYRNLYEELTAEE